MQWKGRLKLYSPKQFHVFVRIISEEPVLEDVGFYLNKEYCRQRRIRYLKFAWYIYILILAIKTLCRWRFFIILTITMLYSCGLAMALAAGYLSVLAWRHSQWLPLHLTLHSKHTPMQELWGKDLKSSLLNQYHYHGDRSAQFQMCLLRNYHYSSITTTP